MPPHLQCRTLHGVSTNEIAPECSAWLAPLAAYMVKGWTRSATAQSILLCAYQCKEFLEAWPVDLQQCLVSLLSSSLFLVRSFRTLHATVVAEPGASPEILVVKNRGLSGSKKR